MENMPSRDISGNCSGECRDRVAEGERERQSNINQEMRDYSGPSDQSPSWTSSRNDPPGAMGGRV